MRRRYGFSTEPRISSLQFFLTIIFAVPAAVLFILYTESEQDGIREAKLKRDLAEARAEVQRLKAAETKRNDTPLSAPASIKASSETAPVLTVPPPDDNGVSTAAETGEVVQSGPLKGLPLDVAKEIQEEYRAASIARATRYHEWDLRRKAHKERDSALFDKELALGDARLAASKKHGELLLAVYAQKSPEELEALRKEALETQPAEVVDLFFRQVAEFGTAKSPEQIKQEAQDIQKNQESLVRAWQALVAEREEIEREREELQRTKPPSPNIDFNEFYTEWKKRNSTKPRHPPQKTYHTIVGEKLSAGTEVVSIANR